MLSGGPRGDAVAYAREHLAPFAGTHAEQTQRLMGSLLYANRLENSPYGGSQSKQQGP